MEALQVYRAKDAVENSFDDLKNQLDMVLKNLTVREVMEDMETLVRITYSGRYGQLYTETNPIQRKIMEVFELTLPT